jgi:poly-gamma-glutamate capsule biosynthesis protein CapA/YwtB (metallophosphatase superfamily)
MVDAGKWARRLRSRPRLLRTMPKRRALKLAGVASALLVMCLPILLWPADEGGAGVSGGSKTEITVPPVVVVPVTLPVADAGLPTTQAAADSGTVAGTEPTSEITIAAVGDIMMHEDLLSSAWDAAEKHYNFGPLLAPVAPYLQSADYTVCNLETRLAGAQAGYSGDPLMNSPAALARALADAGVDLAATANSHSLDWGWQGILGTLGRLEAVGIAHVGTYSSSQQKKTPFIVDIQGIKVAFLNYTSSLNGLDPPAGREGYAVNRLTGDAVAEEAMIARLHGADVVIALLHHGTPYQRVPSSDQIAMFEGSAEVQGLLSRGVDVILGSYPHVVQPIVKVLQYSNLRPNDTYVAYSLGNFLSAERWRYADSGLVAYIHIQKRGLQTDITGIRYLPVYVQETVGDPADDLGDGPAQFRILPVLPWLYPASDTTITSEDETRMDQVWEELSALLYRPDEGIVPVLPTDLGIQ